MGRLHRVIVRDGRSSDIYIFYKGCPGCSKENHLEVGVMNDRLLLQVMGRAVRNKSNFIGMEMHKH